MQCRNGHDALLHHQLFKRCMIAAMLSEGFIASCNVIRRGSCQPSHLPWTTRERSRLMALASILGLSLFIPFILANVESQWMPKEIGSFQWPKPGFTNVIQFEGSNTSIFFSCFDPSRPFEVDPVYLVRNPGRLLDTPSVWPVAMEKLGGEASAFWPNDVIKLPKTLANFEGVLQTSGFIPPGKTFGQLQVFNMDNGAGPFDVASASEVHWSYHWVEFVDVDADGLLDILTARFRFPEGSRPLSELLALINPGHLGSEGENWTGWKQHVIIENGPDGHFSIVELVVDDTIYEAIVASELWTQRVMIYYVEKREGAWMETENIGKVLIDENIGRSYKAAVVDVDRDGNLEILCSSIKPGDEKGGALLLYTPTTVDFRDPWERRTIADGFQVDPDNPTAMAPGQMKLFFPSKAYSMETTEHGPRKPWITLAGDDNGSHYLLYPKSEKRGNFDYSLFPILDTGATITGTIGVADLNDDGYTELVLSAYSANRVHVFTYGDTVEDGKCEAS